MFYNKFLLNYVFEFYRFRTARKPKMPKKKSTDENIEYQSIYNNQRCLLSEPITLHIMKEMEVSPLNDPSLINDCIMDSNASREKMPLQVNFIHLLIYV